MLTDEQLIHELRQGLSTASAELRPRPELSASVHAALAPPRRTRMRWLAPVLPVAVTLAVVGLALISIHPGRQAPTRPQAAPPASHPGVFAPASQRPWALLLLAIPGNRTCIGVTVLTTIHPPTARGSLETDCATPDTHGHAFITRFARELPTRVGARHCAPHGCRLGSERNVGFGLLGPGAVSVTYRASNGSLVTERTGPDGAYLVVQPATRQTCVRLRSGGRTCLRGASVITDAALTAAGIVRVSYRDGTVCRLPAPTRAGVADAGCPQVGIVPRPAPVYVPVHVTPAQVAAPVVARPIPARRYCANQTGLTIACDRSVPPGYTAQPVRRNPPDMLLNLRFTARVAADNAHSDYEWLIAPVGSHRCADNPTTFSGTTSDAIRAGQRLLQQVSVSRCPGRYVGLVSFQPRGRPELPRLGPGLRIHDGSVLVGRFAYTVRWDPRRP